MFLCEKVPECTYLQKYTHVFVIYVIPKIVDKNMTHLFLYFKKYGGGDIYDHFPFLGRK